MNAKEKFLEDLISRRKKSTFKSYRRGLELFEEFYQKDCDTILKEAREKQQSEDVTELSFFDRKIEAFYKWMIDRKYALTSARNNTLGIVAFFNFYRIPTDAKVPMPPPSGKTFIPKIESLRAMYAVADLKGKVILSLGLDLAWRLGDFINLTKNDLPDLNQPSPIPISKITSKENAISATFISSETAELLKAYLPTLRSNNEFLFPSPTKGSHLKDESILKILHELAEKAKIEVPQNKHLVFHSLRKRFLSTCATLNVDSEYACLMVGKKTEIGDSFETYLEDADFKEAFKKVREDALSLTNGKLKAKMESKDAQIETMKKDIDETRRLLKLMTELYGEQLLERAKASLKEMGFKEMFVFDDRINVYYGNATDKSLNFKVKRDDIFELMQKLAEIKAKKQQAEYEKILSENGNGNGEVT